MRRVLQVHNRYRQPGGEDRVVERLTAALAQAGLHVEEYLVDNPEGIAALPALARSVWNQRQARELTRHITSDGSDITHIHNTWFTLSPAVVEAAHHAGPVVMTLHNYRLTCANALLYRSSQPCEKCVGGSPWAGMWLNCYRDPLSSTLAAANIAFHRRRNTWNENVDRFFALSNFAVEIFVRAGIERDRLQVINNHVSDPGRRSAPPSQSDYVLYVGRLSAEKGVAELVERWRRLGSRDLQLVICGDGPLRQELPTSSGVLLKGWTGPEELSELMLGARALIFPSRWYEGQPLTVLEAFASGLPVLGSKLGAVSELLGFLGPEWQAEPNDDDQWQDGFQLLTTDAVDQASQAVRQRFVDNHTESAVAEQVLAGYGRAIEDHPD